METLLPLAAFLWMVLSLIVDISVYKNNEIQLIRFIPAFLKIGITVILIMLNWLLPSPPVVEDGQPLFLILAILIAMGIVIDVLVWFFCEGYPTRQKCLIFCIGIAVFMVICFICSSAEGNYYRKTSTGRYHHYTFTKYSDKMTETLRLNETESECRFSIEAEEGVLELLVTDEDGRVLHSGTYDVPAEFSVNAEGTIMIDITAQDFTGKLDADRIRTEIGESTETEETP